MRLRLLSIAIVLFWMGSVAWLSAVVWAPPGSRMTRIDPREVFSVLFGWNESTTMTLLENGTRRGQVTVNAGSGEDEESGEIQRFFSVSGSFERYDERSSANQVELFLKGTFTFSEAMESRGGLMAARVPGKDLRAEMEFKRGAAGGKPLVRGKVEMTGREIFSFDSEAEGTTTNPAALFSMLGAGADGLPIPGMGALDPSAIQFTTEARVGSFHLAGREMRAYLLTFRGEGDSSEVRVFLSEAGEPLRIETDLGFEAVSEILVPLDAYKRKSSEN